MSLSCLVRVISFPLLAIANQNEDATQKRLSLELDRRNFLKGIGFIGAGTGAALVEHIFWKNHGSKAVAANVVPTETRAKKFDGDEGRIQHGFPPQSQMAT